MNRLEFAKKSKQATAILLASFLGAGALSPTASTAAVRCNPKKAVAKLKQHVIREDVFQWKVAEANDPTTSSVVIKRNHSKKNRFEQVGLNPLVIECGKKAVDYAMVTGYRRGALGESYPVGQGTGLYIDVIPLTQVHLQRTIFSDGSLVVRNHSLQKEIVHPIPQTNIPAFVIPGSDPSGPTILNEMYGATNNSLSLPL